MSKAQRELEEADGEPLINRAVGTRLPPGSTFKLVTAAAAIESGNYDADSMVPGGFRFQLPQSSTTIGNYDGGDCGGRRITLTQGMRSYAGLDRDVLVVGVMDHAEIWDPEVWRDQQSGAEENFANLDGPFGFVED